MENATKKQANTYRVFDLMGALTDNKRIKPMTTELIYTPQQIKLSDGTYSNDVYLDAFISKDGCTKTDFGYNELNTTEDFENIGARWNGQDWVIDFQSEEV